MPEFNEKCKVCGHRFGEHTVYGNMCPEGVGSFNWPFPKGTPASLDAVGIDASDNLSNTANPAAHITEENK